MVVMEYVNVVFGFFIDGTRHTISILCTHFGCRKGTGTYDALFCFTEFIKEACQRKKVVAALVLDV